MAGLRKFRMWDKNGLMFSRSSEALARFSFLDLSINTLTMERSFEKKNQNGFLKTGNFPNSNVLNQTG